jgi:translation initiation factor IF-2
LYRDEDLLFEGEMSSLKHEKDDVREVRQGFDCGVGLKNFHDVEVGDRLECYVLEKSS